ncbi:MAG: bifunctional 5,10-methylenetetrahydrofolate dehydrogenase/5,10-methenyltetrahydrofolate cyclohydrolase [Clostridiales bacterium]|nr:bifunctional 5,10-methylenetetrahydrofolate dehydrogenase/5,10-methenyltetrahydrofolate cyclohydrolase [Clostridiales bacterium]
MLLLKGKPVADKIRENILSAVENCKSKGLDLPRLAIMRAGEEPDDIAYERRIIKNCDSLGIEVKTVLVDRDIGMDEFMDILSDLNEDPKIHGILIFRPLPEQLDLDIISRAVKAVKDIDCMNPINIQKVFEGDTSGILPCTPEACIEILKHYGYELTGKNVAIVNRSMVLGKPLSMLFLLENSTVTICHSKTKDLPKITRNADIVVTGVGRAKFFGPEYFSENSVVVDVGINYEEGGLCGDVDFDSVTDKVSAITPVPGGVGTVTSMILLNNVIKAMRLQNKG